MMFAKKNNIPCKNVRGFLLFFTYTICKQNNAGWSSWKLVGFITQRSQVRVLFPLLWFHSQAVKMLPSQGKDMGSIPIGTIGKAKDTFDS